VAILQEQDVDLASLTGLPIEGTASLKVLTRLREMRFVAGKPPSMEFVFEPYAAGLSGRKLDDVVVSIGPDPMPAKPSEDVLDPETGEVLVAAGSVRPRLPSIEEVNALPLPEGPLTVSTFGQLIDAARRQIYLTMIGLMPQWQDGTEG